MERLPRDAKCSEQRRAGKSSANWGGAAQGTAGEQDAQRGAATGAGMCPTWRATSCTCACVFATFVTLGVMMHREGAHGMEWSGGWLWEKSLKRRCISFMKVPGDGCRVWNVPILGATRAKLIGWGQVKTVLEGGPSGSVHCEWRCWEVS